MDLTNQNCKYCGSQARLVESFSADGRQHFVSVKCPKCGLEGAFFAVGNNAMNTFEVASRRAFEAWNKNR